MSTGKIGVSTGNLFPIIKKFLYSDHEIFLREIVSNAVDASQKMKVLASNGEFKGELGELKVRVKADKAAGTLTVSDNRYDGGGSGEVYQPDRFFRSGGVYEQI